MQHKMSEGTKNHPAIERELTQQQIHLFNQRRADLKKQYNLTDAVKAIAVLTAIVTGYHKYCLFLGIAADFTLPQYIPLKKRQAQYEEQAKKIKEMIKAYWKQGPSVTSNENFLDLLETIAPYTKDPDVILPPGMEKVSASQFFSDRFREILFKPPHKIKIFPYDLEKETSVPKGVDTKLPEPIKLEKKAEVKPVETATPSQGIFQQAWEYMFIPSIPVENKKSIPLKKDSVGVVMPSLQPKSISTVTVALTTTLEAAKSVAAKKLSEPATSDFIEKAKQYVDSNTRFFKQAKEAAPILLAEATLFRYGV